MRKSHTFHHHASPSKHDTSADADPKAAQKHSRARTFSSSRLHLRTRHGGSTSKAISSALTSPLQHIPDNLSFIRNPLGTVASSRRQSISRDDVPPADTTGALGQEPSGISRLQRLARDYPSNVSLLPTKLHARLLDRPTPKSSSGTSTNITSRPTTVDPPSNSKSEPAPSGPDTSALLDSALVSATESNTNLQITLQTTLTTLSTSAHLLTRRLDEHHYALLSHAASSRASLAVRESQHIALTSALDRFEKAAASLRERHDEAVRAIAYPTALDSGSTARRDLGSGDGDGDGDAAFKRQRDRIGALRARLASAKRNGEQAEERLRRVSDKAKKWGEIEVEKGRREGRWWRGMGWSLLSIVLLVLVASLVLGLRDAGVVSIGNLGLPGRGFGQLDHRHRADHAKDHLGVRVSLEKLGSIHNTVDTRWRAILDEL